MAIACWKWKKHGMPPALGWWLMAVGTVRSAIASSCFLGSSASSICSVTFSETQMTSVQGRTVGVWTLLSCTLCFLCAFNLHSKPIYAATFLSFVYGIAYLSVECAVYHTIRAASLAPITIVAVITIVWMLLQWESDRRPHPSREPRKQL